MYILTASCFIIDIADIDRERTLKDFSSKFFSGPMCDFDEVVLATSEVLANYFSTVTSRFQEVGHDVNIFVF
jgi:hypothetical protein